MARLPKLVKIPEVEPFFLDINNTARFLGGKSVKTIRNELSAGTFPVKPRKLGGRVVFPLAELRAYAESVCTGLGEA